MNSATIAAYSFNADLYCPSCITSLLTATTEYDGWELSPGIQMTTEENLSEIAAAFSIDRYDESTYDFSEFPKVAFPNMVTEDDYCGACHEPIL